MSAALWTLWHCSTFEEGLLAVVNAGGDADTNAAVACSILGAKYGFKEIPYITNLENHFKLDEIIDHLLTRDCKPDTYMHEMTFTQSLEPVTRL